MSHTSYCFSSAVRLSGLAGEETVPILVRGAGETHEARTFEVALKGMSRKQFLGLGLTASDVAREVEARFGRFVGPGLIGFRRGEKLTHTIELTDPEKTSPSILFTITVSTSCQPDALIRTFHNHILTPSGS